MAFYVIGGKPDCQDFIHVIYVCEYLAKNLPNFTYTKIQKRTNDWMYWLNDRNAQNGWHHTTSPIIWKELTKRGGKPYLIGGVSEFWEYCFDYYGLESVLPKEDLQKMVDDNMQYLTALESKEAQRAQMTRNVSISGVSSPTLAILLPELVKVKNLALPMGLIIRLLDTEMYLSDHLNNLLHTLDDAMDISTTILLVDTFQLALENCDLFIILDDYTRRDEEDLEKWLIRNMCWMDQLADEVNLHAKRNLRILLANHGPSCFNASILMNTCTAIRLSNIIAITSDVGLCPLNVIAEECKIPKERLGTPPVWGLVGIFDFVDIGGAIERCEMHRPYLRAIRTNGGSTLPLGTIRTELRRINYLTDDIVDLWEKVERVRKTGIQRLGRPLVYSKVSAAVCALNMWYGGEPCDDVISLGICCNGSFGFPPGIVLSQPVVFDGRYWTPLGDFPMDERSKKQIDELVPPIVEVLSRYDITKRKSLGATYI